MPEPIMLPGGHEVPVVGESHYQAELDEICGGRNRNGHWHDCTAVLIHEANNPYDSNAIGVYVHGLKVGHLSRESAKAFAAVAKRLGGRPATCSAMIRGGWDRGGSDQGLYGVLLDLASPPACLRVIETSTPAPEAPNPRRSFLRRLADR